MQIHPLQSLVVEYYRTFDQIKREHEELDSLSFHRQYGLAIGVPSHWPYAAAIADTCNLAISKEKNKIAIIYGSTALYRELADILPTAVNYCSWQEIYVAMDRSGKDAREIKRFRSMLSECDLVFFCGAPVSIPEVWDQVRGFCDGCLIILS